jgi:hypothetical protein
MPDSTFSAPVVARLDPATLLEIRTVRDGLAAMNRLGLGSFRLDTLEWQLAAGKLLQAELAPSPDAVEEAREALCILARWHERPLYH